MTKFFMLLKTIIVGTLCLAISAFALQNVEKSPQWQSSSQWIYDTLVARFTTLSKEYSTAIHYMQKVAEESKQYEAYQYNYALTLASYRYDLSEKIVREWLERFPNDDDAHFSLIEALIFNKKIEQAENETEKLLIRDGGPQNVLHLIQSLSFLSDNESRLAFLKKMSERFPKNPYLHYYVGMIAKEQGLVTQAIDAFNAALALDTRWRQLEVMQAEMLSSVGQLKDALVIMERLRARYPDDVDLISTEIDLLVAHSQWEKALELAQRWAQLDTKKEKPLYLLLAWLYANNKDRDNAAAIYQSLLDRKEIYIEDYFHYMARVAELSGNRDEKVEFLRKIPPDAIMYMQSREFIASSYFSPFDREKALAAFVDFRKTFPENALDSYVLEVNKLIKVGDYKTADTILKEALAQFPESIDLLYAQAEYLKRVGKFNEAEAVYIKILKADPADIDVINAYGYLLLTHTNRQEEAMHLIKSALERYPESPAIQDSYAWLLFTQGKKEEALIWVRRAYSAFNTPQARDEIALHYIEILVANGKKELAKEFYGYKLKANPDNLDLINIGKRFELN